MGKIDRTMVISSGQNPHVKRVVALQQKSSLRNETDTIIVEGRRELMHCMAAGHTPIAVFYCPDLLNRDDLGLNCSCYAVTRDVYQKMAYRGSTEGVIAEVRPWRMSLSDIRLSENPIVVVLEGVEKPGNLGAVLRSADAAHADAVIVCDSATDIYNPNVIRSSIGAVFTVQCVVCDSEQCISFLKDNKIQILTAQLQDSRPYYDMDMCCGTAIVMGTESTGLTRQWRQVADSHIRIPMNGMLDSLNVSVSAAILLFEAVRQRLSGLN